MPRVPRAVVAMLVVIAGCGGSGGSGLDCVRYIEPMEGVHTDMVLMSSLELDLPDGLDIDPPLPADVELVGTTSTDSPPTVAARFTTGATLVQLDGYYQSAFAGCPEGGRSEVPSTGEVIWLGSNGGDTAYSVHFLDGELIVERAPR